MSSIISQADTSVEQEFTKEFQALLDMYDLYVVSYTVYDGRDESCGEGSYRRLGASSVTGSVWMT